MARLTVRKKEFRRVEDLGLRLKGAYAGTVTEEGPLVSDNHVLFNRHFVRKEAREAAQALARQRNGVEEFYPQDRARRRLRTARDAAVHEGRLLGHIATVPALRVRAEQVAGLRFRTEKKGRWRYAWVDAHRLRLLVELYKHPLRFFCASWDQPVVLKRGKRTVGCIMPASPFDLDIEVRR